MSGAFSDPIHGEELTNPGRDDVFTCPHCGHDHDRVIHLDRLTECAACGCPITCRIDEQPVAVCTIDRERTTA